MRPSCILCGRDAARRFVLRGHGVHRCAGCDLEFVWPPPSPDALAAVYAGGYFSGGGHGYADYFGAERAQNEHKSAVRLDALAALGVTRGRLLDVGCAGGTFLDMAAARGFTARGVEPSPEARAAIPPRLTPWIAATLDDARGDGPYDLVTLWDVLEHLADPVATLRALRAMCRPGATLAVVVPVIGNVNTRWAPRTWDQYKPPEHLWYFSRRSLRALLARELGAAVVREDVAWQRPGRFHDPGALRVGACHTALRALDRAVGHALAALVGEHALVDAMAFYARLP